MKADDLLSQLYGALVEGRGYDPILMQNRSGLTYPGFGDEIYGYINDVAKPLNQIGHPMDVYEKGIPRVASLANTLLNARFKK